MDVPWSDSRDGAGCGGSPRRSTRHDRRWSRFARAAGVAAVLALSACSSQPTLVPETTGATPTAVKPTTGLVAALPGSLAWDFNELQATLQGTVGLAVMAVGGERQVTLGDWSTGVAWSTIKVPLTLAALRNNPGYSGAASAAITASDNSSAEMLWQSLGSADTAAQAVEAVLREGGDATTTVPARPPRSEYSAFGQAEWSLSDQLRFASRLPCLPQADTVTALMGKVSSGQRWGLGTLEGARFKGGWGPDTGGDYLVRQFGLLPVTGGEIAIALAAAPDSGSFDDGAALLTKLAGLIELHLEELAGGGCPP